LTVRTELLSKIAASGARDFRAESPPVGVREAQMCGVAAAVSTKKSGGAADRRTPTPGGRGSGAASDKHVASGC